jgi:DNA polymerase-1
MVSFKETAHGERAAANAKIQGSAADIMRRVMLRFRRHYLILCAQIHDELIYQYLRGLIKGQREADVRALKEMCEMGHGYDLDVPLKFDAKIATSWADK